MLLTSSQIPKPNNTRPPPNFQLGTMNRIQMPTRAPVPVRAPIAPPVETDPKHKKMKWGEPTWFLFHTLAEKVKDEQFVQIRDDLLNKIKTICMNLPCPDCANHATKYINGLNFNTIQTKQDLKLMLFQFHNAVNTRKNVPLYPLDQLDSKYSRANTVKIIENFMFYFQDKHFSIRMIANDFHRSRLVTILKDWFRVNIQHFNL